MEMHRGLPEVERGGLVSCSLLPRLNFVRSHCELCLTLSMMRVGMGVSLDFLRVRVGING